jgi:hypothetical protein
MVIDPDTPPEPTAEEATASDPEPELPLDADTIATEPPVPRPVVLPASHTIAPPAVLEASDAPAAMVTLPPTPERPVPTVTLTEPPPPDVDVPVLRSNHPLLPDFDDPVEATTVPETPLDATPAVTSATLPEPELELAPLVSDRDPPVPRPLVLPAATVTTPPFSLADTVRPPRN